MKCVARELFTRRFPCMIPYRCYAGERRLQLEGVGGTTSKEELSAVLERPTRVDLYIPQMARLIGGDEPVTILEQQKNIQIIYELTTHHLDNWLFIATNEPHFILPPFEDIADLNELAKVCHKYITPKYIPNGLSEFLSFNPAAKKDIDHRPFNDYTDKFIELENRTYAVPTTKDLEMLL